MSAATPARISPAMGAPSSSRAPADAIIGRAGALPSRRPATPPPTRPATGSRGVDEADRLARPSRGDDEAAALAELLELLEQAAELRLGPGHPWIATDRGDVDPHVLGRTLGAGFGQQRRHGEVRGGVEVATTRQRLGELHDL